MRVIVLREHENSLEMTITIDIAIESVHKI